LLVTYLKVTLLITSLTR